MKVLVVGSGGREHALAWRLIQGPSVSEVVVAPGNAGTACEPGISNANVSVDDFDGLIALVRSQDIDLTVVGPEVPLVNGICDRFAAAGLACFGPSAGAAQLEGSKAFAKEFLARYHIPTGAYQTFSEVNAALDYVRAQGTPIVIKADGLAAGKGVVVAQEMDQAESAITDMLSGNAFGDAGARVVIEEFLPGEEASFICLCDGTTAIPFASSQDHKARDDGDNGPNTGGMGAYSPAPVVSPAVHDRVMREVIEPTLKGMAADGHPYTGFLYAGLMISADGTPKVIEFNARFGDPEAQPVMTRLKSDLAELCTKALAGELEDVKLEFTDEVALGVVLAAGGYPLAYAAGETISGLSTALDENHPDTKVFHAGTALEGNDTVTSGGRVLCVVALGESVAQAQQRAYARVDSISWKDVYCRRDIGYRAIAVESGRAETTG